MSRAEGKNMKRYRIFFHLMAVVIELAILFAIIAYVILGRWVDERIVRPNPEIALAISAMGFEVCLFVVGGIFFWMRNKSRSIVPSVRQWGVVMLGGGLFGLAACFIGSLLVVRAFPELHSFREAKHTQERLAGFKAIKVSFDPAGGTCSDVIRFVKRGETYGENMNLYPSEDPRYLISLGGTQIDVAGSWFISKLNVTSQVDSIAHYVASSDAIAVGRGEPWTYVVDIQSITGELANWIVGQTAMTSWNSYAQLGLGRIGSNIKEPGHHFVRVTGSSWEKCNLLDRAILQARVGAPVEVVFRVALFAGTGVTDRCYRYVSPGETIKCPLPIPERKGFAFDGWYIGDVKIVDSSPVIEKHDHVLTARWRML